MSVTGRRRFRSIIEEAITSKPKIKKITEDTIRSDAAAILESLVAELDEDDVVGAMNHQGFQGEAYRQTIKLLTAPAKQRRALRQVGTQRRDAPQGLKGLADDVTQYWEWANRHDLRLRNTLTNGDAHAAIKEIAAHYRVARNFRTKFDVDAGLRRFAPVVEALPDFSPPKATDPIRAVMGLATRLSGFYENEVLSASSKFLWFTWGRDVIIYDSQAFKTVRTHFPQLRPNDYAGYCKAWTSLFDEHKDQIIKTCSRFSVPAEHWFYQRVFDWHLWRLGGKQR